MNAYKVAVTVTEDGTVVLRGLPLPAGQVVEVIVLAASAVDLSSSSAQQSTLEPEYLAGISAQMSEWASPEDEVAYRDL